MSSTLQWRPVRESGKSLPDELKRVLGKGSFVDREFSADDLPYLRGLEDAGVNGASQVIEAIEKHDHIHLFETS